MQQRRDEILAKRAKLAELKRQRELRASQATARQSISQSEVGPSAAARLRSALS
jgi:dynein intermediate chain